MGGPAARVTSTLVQDVPPDGAFVALLFPDVIFDTDTLYDPAFPTRLTATVAGIYQITGNVLFDQDPGPDSSRGLLFRLNGTTLIGGTFGPSTNNPQQAPTAITSTTLYNLAAGDYVELIANQTSNQVIQSIPQPLAVPNFMMVRVADAA